MLYQNRRNTATLRPDLKPPAAWIVSPTAGSTLSGVVTVIADATDDVAVTGVRLLLDGLDLVPELTMPPYQVAWDASSVTPGTHTLTAIAYNTAGLATVSAPVTVNVARASFTFSLSSNAVNVGEVVTLTATAIENGAPITTGSVTFWNGTRVLGTAQIVGANPAPGYVTGTATLKMRFAPGTHTLTATLNKMGTLGLFQSAPQTLVVSPGETQPSSVTLTVQPDSGNSSNYDFTATVTGFGMAAPSGTVNFLDTTVSPNTNLGTVTLSGVPSLSFQPEQPLAGPLPQAVAVADLNGDGIPDLVTTDPGHGAVWIALGNGDGTFSTPASYLVGATNTGTFNLNAVVVGDFNGDGIPDLVVVNAGDSTVRVLLGNGDGSFQSPVLYSVPGYPFGITMADFNGDGVEDLAVAIGTGVSILSGNGDGTFQAPITISVPGGDNAYSIVAADFNGDGIPDLALGDGYNGLNIMLGNGDGTFRFDGSYVVGILPWALTAGDFKGDGTLDLAVANYGDNTVSVLPGNGDGTFQPQQTYTVGTAPMGIVSGDFNGDGTLDLAVANQNGYTVSVLLGNGDGTFQVAQAFPAGPDAQGLAAADLNGDGLPDLVITSWYVTWTYPGVGAVNVLMSEIGFTAEVNDIAVTGTGNHTVQAAYVPDPKSNYNDGISSGVTVQANSPLTAILTLSATPSSTFTYGTSFSIIASIARVGAWPLPGGSVTYQVDGASANQVPLSGGAATISLGALNVGNHSITVSYNGDSLYSEAGPQTISITLNKAPLTVTADNQSMTYGASIPPLTCHVSGAVNGDVITCSATTTSTPVVTGSPYAIVPSAFGTALENYTVSDVNGELTVLPATPNVTVSCASVPYDGLPYSCTASVAGVAGAIVTGSVTWSPASSETNIGSYIMTLTFASSDPDYSNATGSGTLTITGMLVTASVTVANKVYDGTDNATITGCTLHGVLAADVHKVSCSAAAASFAAPGAGVEAVKVTGIGLSGTLAGKYSLSSTTATTTATISKATQSPTVHCPGPLYYDETAHSCTFSGNAGACKSESVTNAPGSSSLALSCTGDANHLAWTGKGKITINKLTSVISNCPVLTSPYDLATQAASIPFTCTVIPYVTAQYTASGPAKILTSASAPPSLTFTGVGTVTVTVKILANTNWTAASLLSGAITVVNTKAVTASPGSLGFKNTVEGTTSAALTVTVTNRTGEAVRFTSSSLANFSATPVVPAPGYPNSCQAIAGGTCSFNVVFNPHSPGALAETLTITPNVGAGNALSVYLSGTGVQ